MLKIWCDFVEREFLQNEFKQLIDSGVVTGATSNPSIFEHALKQSSYRAQIDSLAHSSLNAKERYEKIVLQDIHEASKILYPLFRKDRDDGYISLEIDPNICHDANASISEGTRLHRELHEENVMIKIPATDAGYDTMRELLASEISVNATLVFTEAQMLKCLKAFNESRTRARFVISVFVSRFDRAMDSLLPQAGLYGIYNATNIYERFKSECNSTQARVLFASTSVKEASGVYTDKCYYVYPLAFSDCINTMPLDTIRAVDMGRIQMPMEMDFSKLVTDGVDVNSINDKLVEDALSSFVSSFNGIIDMML